MSPRLAHPCDLWVVPHPDLSRWFARLDWYLNWQMCRGLAYVGLHLPMETLSVAEEHGLTVPVVHNSKSLLIGHCERVPAKMCLVLDGADQLREWLGRIAEQAAGLKVSSLHVFLPTGASMDAALSIWQDLGRDISAIFTSDLESTV
jgi:hypothetical protein